MSDFPNLYLQVCRDYHLEPQDCILDKLNCLHLSPRSNKAVVNLSANSISVHSCCAIARVLATDRCIESLKLADCMLCEDGIKEVAKSLATNVAVKKLDLKGNNIKGVAAEAVGSMLRQNNTLTSLVLEWNSLGMLETSFSLFCDGLAVNRSLRDLDLRNNQISHEGGKEVARAIKRNNTVRKLDLRWNNLGIIGGRALLDVVKYNTTLVSLTVDGNNIPTDIVSAIATAVNHNCSTLELESDYVHKTRVLTSQLRQSEQDSQLKMSDLRGVIDQKEEFFRQSSRSTNDKIEKLEEALSDRKSAFDSITSQYSMTESQLALCQQKCRNLSSELEQAQQELGLKVSQHQIDLRHFRDEKGTSEDRLLKDLGAASERCIDLQTQADSLETKCKYQQENIYDLKSRVTELQAEQKLKQANCEDKLQREKQKCKQLLDEAEAVRSREANHLKLVADELEQNFKDRIQKMEAIRLSLEEEISHLKSSAMNDRLTAEENVAQLRQRMKVEEETRRRQLEDKYRALKHSHDDLQSSYDHQADTLSRMQSQNVSLESQIDKLQRKIDSMRREIDGSNAKIEAAVNREKETQDQLREDIKKLEKTISEDRQKCQEHLDEKDRHIASISDRLRDKDAVIHDKEQQIGNREREIQEMRSIIDQEEQRKRQLFSAVDNYCRSPLASSQKR